MNLSRESYLVQMSDSNEIEYEMIDLNSSYFRSLRIKLKMIKLRSTFAYNDIWRYFTNTDEIESRLLSGMLNKCIDDENRILFLSIFDNIIEEEMRCIDLMDTLNVFTDERYKIKALKLLKDYIKLKKTEKKDIVNCFSTNIQDKIYKILE
jgi:hypothetical protein